MAVAVVLPLSALRSGRLWWSITRAVRFLCSAHRLPPLPFGSGAILQRLVGVPASFFS